MDWIKNYIKFLDCVNPQDLRVEEAMQLKNKNLPTKLYKYRSATDYAIKNLATDTVWLNTPSEYNDPFEFAEYIDFSKLQAPINGKAEVDIVADFATKYPVPQDVMMRARKAPDPLEFLIDYALGIEGRSKEQISVFKSVMRQVIEDQYADVQQWKIDFMQEQMKVCSFCESHEQLLMWSHYADYHTGFCVEYNISLWPDEDIRKRLLYPVIYQGHRYDATAHLMQNLIGNNGFNPLYAIISGSTKSIEWSYEKEWRFIFNIGGTFPKQNCRMDCQTKVFLGYRMAPERKSEIIAICNSRGIRVFQARPSVDHFKLIFEEIFR
ncbi:DUF2971 domain-containing protein [Mucilaginibacter sp. UR6-1]|uniref:DUF2971 domain-containing protein n=1 Tax=Mucilaginibacter sp. UR6-1 TaxID=1435643 RepID=UPI001E37A8E3|nr:DUF2971 domain-containing protein [Mucilaginibacter sp. UR6-1]MCC8409324.1 DUF2971 domain-containing protein [Mucilaginibacter sp. UR6-1]